MKIYKFRPLANIDDRDRLRTILKTGKFHCAKYSELNDPMEGVYRCLNYNDNRAYLINEVFTEKSNHRICSFPDEKALSNPLMWGHYANGFRGVAIEIEVCENEVNKIKYKREIPGINIENQKEDALKILTTKLLPWKYEYEYRFLKKNIPDKVIIGKITALYFGDPYGITINKKEITNRSAKLQEYHLFKNDIWN